MTTFLRSLIAEIRPLWMSAPAAEDADNREARQAETLAMHVQHDGMQRPAAHAPKRQVAAYRRYRRPDLASNM